MLIASEIIVLQTGTNVIQMNYIHGSTNLCYRLLRYLTLKSLSGLVLSFVRFRPICYDARETDLKLTFVLSSFYVLEILLRDEMCCVLQLLNSITLRAGTYFK